MKVLLLLLLALASTALADTAWQSRPEASSLEFLVNYEGDQVVGVFRQFEVKFDVDSEDWNAVSLEVLVDISCADMDSDDLNSEILKADWFAEQQFPEARFFSDEIEEVSENEFIAHGTLKLKGIEKSLDVPFNWTGDYENARMAGEVDLNRTNFDIGEGDWASGDTIGLTVKVRFDVQLEAR